MTPTTTYRLQLRAEFGFHDAAAVVPYLAELGVSHVYCSPVLQAAPGSAHGYDVVDHSRLSEDLGGDEGWAVLVEACEQHGLRLVVDVVPNHMAAPTPERLNPALWDVLERGRQAAHATWFDVDWESQHGKLMMPVLGDPLPEVEARGEIDADADTGVIRYFDHVFPLAAGTSQLDEQHYRLCHWRLANHELNYRRFFDVTTLLGLRVEVPEVFDATHERLLSLPGPVDGWRIDHPDGLAEPHGYLQRLADRSPDAWIVVEKILESGESLPSGWRCAGTTGYDALNQVLRLLVDTGGEAAMTDLYTELTGMPGDFHVVVEASKRLVLDELFDAEINRLVGELGRPEAKPAVVELIASLDVYRAYDADPSSLARLDAAAARATARRPELAEEIEWVRERALGTRFQQTTGPVMAKGVEDTALYRWHRLAALNEVGGDPSEFGAEPAHWHEWCTAVARDWPATMTTLSTHDTKRSADIRARLCVLSEIPEEWRAAVTRWREAARRHGPPDPNTDYLMWQTIVGAWPLPASRLTAYLEKASREAKLQTSWTEPDTGYDERLRRYAEAVLADDEVMTDVEQWVRRHIEAPGLSNSLTQKLVQLTMPGVPDIYQGDELLDYSLVDPDNRRPVDYATRREQLRALGGAGTDVPADAVEPKLRVTAAAVRLRRSRPELVGAPYLPLAVTGPAAGHLVAFARGQDVTCLATRLPVGLQGRGGWQDTRVELPGRGWRDLITGRDVTTDRVADVLRELPVALLSR